MVVFSPRCRHLNVTWKDSHSCQCGDCNKVGHWFENEGIVMWVQAKREQPSTEFAAKLPMAAGISAPPNADGNCRGNAVA